MPISVNIHHTKSMNFAYIIAFIILLSICGCGSESSNEPSSGDGSIALRVQWKDGAQKSAGEQTPQLSCTDLNLATIQAKVYDQNGELVASSALWPCDEHRGTLGNVKVGSDYTAVILGRASDQESDPVIIHGQRPDVVVRKEETSGVDIVAQAFVPRLTGASGICKYIDLEWDTVPGAQNYEVSISETSDMSNASTHTTAETRFAPQGLDCDTPYFWQVRALDAYGNASPGSDSGNFTPVGSHLVKSFTAGNLGSNPSRMVAINENLYFSAHDETGLQLWRYDGQQLKKIAFGNSKFSAIEEQIVEFQGNIYFSAYDGADYELWTVDGDTAYEIDIHSTGTSNPRNLTVFDGHLYFTVTESGNDTDHSELYKFDGSVWTPIDTDQPISGRPRNFVVAGNALYFIASSEQGTEPFKWDGQNLTAFDINPAGDSDPWSFTEINNQLYFYADDGSGDRLHMCDDQTSQPFKIDGYDDISVEVVGKYRSIAGLDGAIYFIAATEQRDSDLFMYPGTGTEAVNLNINATGSSSPQGFRNIDGKLYFSAIMDDSGREPYYYSNNGHGIISDIQSGPAGSDAYQFKEMKDRIYFAAENSPQYGRELWSALKTTHETNVADICPGSCSSYPTELTTVEINGEQTLFFSADNGRNGRELWSKTSSGEPQLIDINRAIGGVSPYGLIEVNGMFYFGADDGENGIELWQSDGTATGTRMVADINPNGDSRPYHFTGFNDKLYFTADAGDGKKKLYEYDGNTASVIDMGVDDYNVYSVAASGGSLFATLRNYGDSGVYKYDGKASPTKLLHSTFADDYSAGNLTDVNGMLYFTGRAKNFGLQELYKYNGKIVTQINVNNSTEISSRPAYLTPIGSDLFFTAEDENEQTHLYRYNGTSPIKIQTNQNDSSSPRRLTKADGKLYFIASDGIQRNAYVFDNGSLGKIEITPESNHNAMGFFTADNTLYILVAVSNSNNETTAVQLWKTSSTTQAAEKIKELRKDLHRYTHYALHSDVELNGRAYFSLIGTNRVMDPFHNIPLTAEIWETDGTAQNTNLLFETDNYMMPMFKPEMIKKDDTFYYIFYDTHNGPGLWRYCP